MTVNMNQEMRVVNTLTGETFYDNSLPVALKKAQEFAGEDGFVASMPQLLNGRVTADANDGIWDNWFTALSEEDVGRTPYKNAVVVAVHGGGVLSTPERIKKAYSDGLTKQYAAKFTDKEFKELLNGKLPDGTEIPVFMFDDFKKGITDLPKRYAVVMDFDEAKKTQSGYQKINGLYQNPLVIARAGGVEQAAAYVNKANKRYGTGKLGNWHPFANVNPDEAQGRLLFLGNYFGLSGNNYLVYDGRFVGVKAPEALAREKSAPESVVAPTLEQVLAVANKFTAEVNKPELQRELVTLYK